MQPIPAVQPFWASPNPTSYTPTGPVDAAICQEPPASVLRTPTSY